MKKTVLIIAAIAALFAFSFTGCKRNPVIAPADLPAPIAAPVYPMNVIIDDCDDNDNVTAWGGYWFTYDDNKPPNFGTSTIEPKNGALFTMTFVGPDWNSLVNGPNVYCARFTGDVKRGGPTSFAYPLIGVGIGLSPMDDKQNFYTYSGIRFWVKRGLTDQIISYRLALKSANNPDPALYDFWGMTFSAPAGVWTQINIPFSSPSFMQNFGLPLDKQTSLSQVTGIQIQTKNSPDPAPYVTLHADLSIDKIELYR